MECMSLVINLYTPQEGTHPYSPRALYFILMLRWRMREGTVRGGKAAERRELHVGTLGLKWSQSQLASVKSREVVASSWTKKQQAHPEPSNSPVPLRQAAPGRWQSLYTPVFAQSSGHPPNHIHSQSPGLQHLIPTLTPHFFSVPSDCVFCF